MFKACALFHWFLQLNDERKGWGKSFKVKQSGRARNRLKFKNRVLFRLDLNSGHALYSGNENMSVLQIIFLQC